MKEQHKNAMNHHEKPYARPTATAISKGKHVHWKEATPQSPKADAETGSTPPNTQEHTPSSIGNQSSTMANGEQALVSGSLMSGLETPKTRQAIPSTPGQGSRISSIFDTRDAPPLAQPAEQIPNATYPAIPARTTQVPAPAPATPVAGPAPNRRQAVHRVKRPDPITASRLEAQQHSHSICQRNVERALRGEDAWPHQDIVEMWVTNQRPYATTATHLPRRPPLPPLIVQLKDEVPSTEPTPVAPPPQGALVWPAPVVPPPQNAFEWPEPVAPPPDSTFVWPTPALASCAGGVQVPAHDPGPNTANQGPSNDEYDGQETHRRIMEVARKLAATRASQSSGSEPGSASSTQSNLGD